MGFTGRQKALQLWALCRRTSRRSPSRPIECLGSPSVLHRRTAAGGQRFRTTYGRHSLEPLSSFSRHALSDDDLLHRPAIRREKPSRPSGTTSSRCRRSADCRFAPRGWYCLRWRQLLRGWSARPRCAGTELKCGRLVSGDLSRVRVTASLVLALLPRAAMVMLLRGKNDIGRHRPT